MLACDEQLHSDLQSGPASMLRNSGRHRSGAPETRGTSLSGTNLCALCFNPISPRVKVTTWKDGFYCRFMVMALRASL